MGQKKSFQSKCHSHSIEIYDGKIYFWKRFFLDAERVSIKINNIEKIELATEYGPRPALIPVSKIFIHIKNPQKKIKIYGNWKIDDEINPMFQWLQNNLVGITITPMAKVEELVSEKKQASRETKYIIIGAAPVFLDTDLG